jgi:hypothetical protein
VCLLDSSHPGQLLRSSQQAMGADDLEAALRLVATSLRLGGGGLLRPPAWLDMLPAEVRPDLVTAYRDSRQWDAACREWRAARRHFDKTGGILAPVDVPLLVVTAGRTAAVDPVHAELQDDFARQAPRAESHVLPGVAHERMLADAAVAHQVAGLIAGFAGAETGPGPGAGAGQGAGAGERP